MDWTPKCNSHCLPTFQDVGWTFKDVIWTFQDVINSQKSVAVTMYVLPLADLHKTKIHLVSVGRKCVWGTFQDVIPDVM